MPYIENLERNRKIKDVLLVVLIVIIIGVLAWLGFRFWSAKPSPAPENSAGGGQPATPSQKLLESVTAPQESGSQEGSKEEAVPPPVPADVQQNLTAPAEEQPAAGAVPKNVMDSLNAPK